ncbi:hypothetical protein KBC70_02835 [Candidatus Woesebacteria bacterium]|nr:hypothetical protein [Candidatus Woesebacteria bacterium]
MDQLLSSSGSTNDLSPAWEVYDLVTPTSGLQHPRMGVQHRSGVAFEDTHEYLHRALMACSRLALPASL